MFPPEVDRTLQPVFVVRSHIKENRKTVLWMNPAESSVQSHLSDRDAHASRTLVAESEDSFSIADHDAFNSVVPRMVQDLSDTFLVRIAEKQASRFSPYFAETLAALTDSWCVHEREHFFDIANQQSIEKRLVRILKVAEKDI